MAASHPYLSHAEPGPKILNFPKPANHEERIYLVHGFQRIWLRLACPIHSWNWPRPIQGKTPEGFDAHETCFKCGTQRFYNTTRLKAGPLYRTRVAGTASHSAPRLRFQFGFKEPKLLWNSAKALFGNRKSRSAVTP